MNFLKTLHICLILASIIISDTLAATAGNLERKRIAIFDEAGFPNKSKFSIAWFKESAESAGAKVDTLTLKQIQDINSFSREKYDTIIFPHGGYVPLDAEEALGRFMGNGGTIVITGDMFGNRPYPKDVELERQKLLKDAQTSADGSQDKYNDFVMKNGLTDSCFLRYNTDMKRWIVPVSYLYYHGFNSKKIMDEFGLYGWPNHCSFGNPRPFKGTVFINSELAKFLPGLPEQITAPADFPQKNGGLTRVNLPTKAILGTGTDGAFSFNKLLYLYRFEKPSQTAYPSFNDAGKKEEDRNTDFFIYRYHDSLHEGATLVVLGKIGSLLLESEAGSRIFANILKLAESSLPGEYTEEYYKKSHLADKYLFDLQSSNIRLRSILAKYGRLLFADGKSDDLSAVENLLNIQKKIFTEADLKYFTITQQRIKGMKTDDSQMDAFIDFCRSELLKVEALNNEYSVKLQAILKTPEQKAVKHPFKKLAWGMLTLGPTATYEREKALKSLEEIGIRDAPIYSEDWNRTSSLYEKTGIFSGYHFFYHDLLGSIRKDKSMGVFNPKTGKVAYKKKHSFPDAAAWQKYENRASWFLTKAQNEKGIGSIVYGEERDMEWSMWGDYMQTLFLKYLAEKYSSINELNKKWDSSYSDFSEIKLPVKQPESRTEHALWEDWTRYREIYRLQEEVIPLVNMVKKYAPRLLQWYYGSYYMHKIHPANGINYYEVGKLFDPASMEGTFRIGEEVLNADICGFQKKVIIPEWGTFYFSPGGISAQNNLLKAAVWNSVNFGMIGCHTFLGWEANPNFISTNGLLTPLGCQMRELNADLKYLQHIYLDGTREEVPIRILYSPTTRRHTSWPDIEGDKSLEAVCGYYDALRSLHYQARAIDEMAVMEGRLPEETKILIVPLVTYMNSSLFQKIEEFVKKGGTVVATPDSGRFDEYGVRRDFLLRMSGVTACLAGSKKIEDIDFKSFTKDTLNLKPIFPESSKNVLSYADGTTAGVLSTAGKGKLLILGIPFGREYSSNFKKAPKKALGLLKKILDTTGFEQDYISSDDHLVIRPWLYNGDKYLMLNYLQRDDLTIRKKSKGFPLKRSPELIPFDLYIRGPVEVEDYLLGKRLATSFDGTFTIVKGIIENPGGMAYKLTASPDKKISAPPENKAISLSDDLSENKSSSPEEKSYSLPFEGRLFWEAGKVKLGNYLFASEIITDGQWAGKFYVSIEHGGKIIKKECKKSEIVKFQFDDATLVIECEEVISVMPGNIKCRIYEIKNTSSNKLQGCRVREEKFHGQNSIVIENAYVFTRIIPELGGRIIEFKTSENSSNNMFCNPNAIAGGTSNLWVNYGGMEENAGAYPGPCWNISYKYKILENTEGKAVLALERSKPISWKMSYGAKKEGTNSFEKIFSLSADSTFLHVKIREYNETTEEDVLTLRTHPVFNIAGDVNSSDTLYFPDEKGNTIEMPYKNGTNTQFKNNGNWCAFLDREKRTGLIQTFKREDVSALYTWMGDEGYNVELVYNLSKAQAGKFIDFEYDMGIITGLPGISGFGDNILVDIIPEGRGIYGKGEDIKFTLTVSSIAKCKAVISSEIRDEKNNVLKTFKNGETILQPGIPFSTLQEWNPGDIKDGVCKIVANISVDGKTGFHVCRKIEIAGEAILAARKKIEDYRAVVDNMKKKYRSIKDNSLRDRIVRGTVILDELEEAVALNNKSKIDDLTVLLEKIIR